MADAYPTARFTNNFLATTLSTGVALGIDSSVVSSGGTYNANGQTKATISFAYPAYFATWEVSKGGSLSDPNAIARLLADPTLVDDLFTYLYNGWKCTDAEARGTAVGGGDMGVGYSAASSGGTGMAAILLAIGVI